MSFHSLDMFASFKFTFFSDTVRGAQYLRSRRVSVLLPHIFRDYASTLPQRSTETVSLPVGGNGFVDLEILHPLLSSSSRTSHHSTSSNNDDNSNKILVHLPAGPKPPGATQRCTSLLANSIHDLAPHFQDTTLVDIHYRLGPRSLNALLERDHRFPTPIHDVFTAFDYLADSASPHNKLAAAGQKGTETEIGITPPSPQQPCVCLYGSHIGGALALALVLTKPNQIHALAIEDPLVDWVVLDELATQTHEGIAALQKRTTRSARTKQEEHDRTVSAARALIKLRTSLFRTPSGFFDSFASPMLFLRAPGRDTPTTETAEPELEGSGLNGREEDEPQTNGHAEKAFGPYDDDWHAVQMSRLADQQSVLGTGNMASLNGASMPRSGRQMVEQPVTDLSYWTPDRAGSERNSSPRRRKVLRRWPSITTSEEALLPYVNIFLNSPQASTLFGDGGSLSSDISPVTQAQGVELLDLLRRACFWGREKGFAEERVISTELSAADSEGRDKLVQWFQMRFADTRP